jgi:hypothetical protein
VIRRSSARQGLRRRELTRLRRLFGCLDILRGRFSRQYNVRDVGSISVRVLRGLGETQRRDQAIRDDGVGQRLKQLEGTQATLQQRESMAIGREYSEYWGPFLGDLTEQLEARTVFQTLGGYDDLKRVRSQQIEAVTLVCDGVDSK